MLSEKELKEIENLKEYELFFTIDTLGLYIWRTNHDVSHDRYEMTPDLKEDLAKMSEAQQHCVQQLTKFGIDPESVKDKPNGDYWKWYNHWNNWKDGMSDKKWDELNAKMSYKKDVSEFLPNKWNEIN